MKKSRVGVHHFGAVSEAELGKENVASRLPLQANAGHSPDGLCGHLAALKSNSQTKSLLETSKFTIDVVHDL
jgi:hypothetical protein